METFCEFGVVVGVDVKGGEVDADGSGIADGGCTTHLQLTDGRPDFPLCFEVKVFGFVWELCLVNDDEGTFAVVKGDGFHGEDVGVHCMPPKRSDISTLPARPPEWSQAHVRGR